jgi:hypothetical protein
MTGKIAGRTGIDVSHHDDDLGIWPHAVDALDEFFVMLDIRGSRYIVGHIVCPQIDHHEVCSRVLAEIPGLWVVCSPISHQHFPNYTSPH